MFRFFETRINPYPKGEPTTPPRKLLPFLLHYSRPLQLLARKSWMALELLEMALTPRMNG